MPMVTIHHTLAGATDVFQNSVDDVVGATR